MANGVILGQTLNTNGLLPLDGSRSMTGALNMGSHKITNLSNGTTNNDAVNYYQLMNSTVSASRISGTLSTSNIPNLSASKITSGTFSTSRIPSLDASKITSGQFNTDRIPNLSASKITSGVLSVANGGTGVNSLDALYDGLIIKTVYTDINGMDFFGPSGCKIPFYMCLQPNNSISLDTGAQNYEMASTKDGYGKFYVPLHYAMMASGSSNVPDVVFPIGYTEVSMPVDFRANNIVYANHFSWLGSGTITFYSFA